MTEKELLLELWRQLQTIKRLLVAILAAPFVVTLVYSLVAVVSSRS